MPGLGWMLKRSLFEEELEPNWPTVDKVRCVLGNLVGDLGQKIIFCFICSIGTGICGCVLLRFVKIENVLFPRSPEHIILAHWGLM